MNNPPKKKATKNIQTFVHTAKFTEVQGFESALNFDVYKSQDYGFLLSKRKQ